VVERIYPGMETFERIVEVSNRGEMTAQLDYEIESLKIMDEYYEVGQSGLTSSAVETRMANNYPFTILIEKNDANLTPGSGTGYFKITVSWPYESGDDALDTYWGEKAYEYYNDYPGEECIELTMLLKATQERQEQNQNVVNTVNP